MEKQAIKRYSQAFKQQVVREYEGGGTSIYHLLQKYGIGARDTVKRWVERYGRGIPGCCTSAMMCSSHYSVSTYFRTDWISFTPYSLLPTPYSLLPTPYSNQTTRGTRARISLTTS